MRKKRLAMAVSLVFVFSLLPVTLLPQTAGAETWVRAGKSYGGHPENRSTTSMAVYMGELYMGTTNEKGCEVWRYSGMEWTQVVGQDGGGTPGTGPGFGDDFNINVHSLHVYKRELYATTDNMKTGCEVWRYNGTSWSQVGPDGFGDVLNWGAHGIATYKDDLYVGTANDSKTGGTGCQVWCYNGSTWRRVAFNGIGEKMNNCAHEMASNGDYLFTGVHNDTGCQVWRFDGTNWIRISDSGFGSPFNTETHGMTFVGTDLYVGTANNMNGCEFWRYDGSRWSQVADSGFGDRNNRIATSSCALGSILYVGTFNDVDGCELWRYADGKWRQANDSGFGSRKNTTADSIVVFDLHIYVGTWNMEGTENWRTKIPGWTEWFLAEGSTGSDYRGNFETWILVQNPGEEKAEVDLYYQTPSGEKQGPHITLEPRTRQTKNVADVVHNEWSVSTRVTSDKPIIAERAMYWHSAGGVYRQAAHDSIGVVNPSLQWFLAEGSTGLDYRGSFETWILVQNPGGDKAEVDLFYQTPYGEKQGQHITLEPHTRQTKNVADVVPNEWSVSTHVLSDKPVIAERAMYWHGAGGVYRQAAHDSIGTPGPVDEWFLAEGSTGSDYHGSFETWVLVQNPGDEKAEVDLFYQTPAGEKQGQHITLDPRTRQTRNVADVVPGEWSVSTRVASDKPVIAERAMYWHSAVGVYRQAAHDSIGITGPATQSQWFLAEGSTGSDYRGNFETWILVQNPGGDKAEVDLFYQTPYGEKQGPHITLEPHTRQTKNVADVVPGEWSVSTRVTSDKPVIAERAMYWHGAGGIYRQAAHDSIGFDP